MKSKSLLAFTSIILLFSSITKAQENLAFDKGSTVVSAGFGFPSISRLNTRAAYSNGFDSYSVIGFGPLLLKGDYGIVKFNWGHTVGAGLVIGYSFTNVNYTYSKWNSLNNTYSYSEKSTMLVIGARGTYHFFTKEKLDCYASIGLGYFNYSERRATNDPTGFKSNVTQITPLIYSSGTVGIRYFFTENIGVYSELGWDMSAPIQAGVAFKF